MFFLLYRHADDCVCDAFPKISEHLPKISEDFPKLFRRPDVRFRTFSENSRRFPKIGEDFRGRHEDVSDDTPANLSTIFKETYLISMKSSINSRVRLWKINHSGPGCNFYEFYEWHIFQ